MTARVDGAVRLTRSMPYSLPAFPRSLVDALHRAVAFRRFGAAEVLQVAKTQRWMPEEVLRTLIEAEIAARDASNPANRLKAAAFPISKEPDGFDVDGPSVRLHQSRATYNTVLVV